MTIPDPIETATNEAIITFQSDNFEYTVYKGFSISFNASNESMNVWLIYRSREIYIYMNQWKSEIHYAFTVCGGELTAMQGTIKSNGYPNIATRSRYEIESLCYIITRSCKFFFVFFIDTAIGESNCQGVITWSSMYKIYPNIKRIPHYII